MKTTVFLFILATVCSSGYCTATTAPTADDDVKVSRKCAAVLLSAATTLGGATAYYAVPAAMCAAGFCPVGVASSSIASWWQSTMPLISQGSLFAALQSAAMAGAGAHTIISGAVVGGAAGASYLQAICEYVDKTDEESTQGKAFEVTHSVVTTAIEAKNAAQQQCSESETCTAVVNAAATAKDGVTTAFSSMWNSASKAAAEAAASAMLSMEIFSLEVKIKTEKRKFMSLAYDMAMKDPKWWATNAPEMVNSIQHIIKTAIEQKMLKNPDTNVADLQRQVEALKDEFGQRILDLILGCELVPSGFFNRAYGKRPFSFNDDLNDLCNESYETIRTLQLSLQEKRTRQDVDL